MEDRETIINQKYHQISFLLWTGLKQELRIGPIIFWPFSKAKDKIHDERMLNHLTKYFRSYVDHQGNPVDTITICSHKNIDFRNLNNEEYNDLRNAVNVLIFCTIAPQTKIAVCNNNKSMGPPSAEVFQLITQNFKPGDDHIAVCAGSVLSGGWKIGEITFSKPWSTGGSFGASDTELVKGFNKVFEPTFSLDIRERLFRSLEWFRLAHVESDEVSPLSKVIMMATAFERHKRILAERLRKAIEVRLRALLMLNKSRINYLEKFQQLIDEYNAGSMNVEEYYRRLLEFVKNLDEEEKRALSENLTEEELAIYDLLVNPPLKMTQKDIMAVKKVAHDLLEKLKSEKLVLDWRKKQQARAAVRLCIEEILEGLPPVFTTEIYRQKCELIYQHVYESYYGSGRSVYSATA